MQQLANKIRINIKKKQKEQMKIFSVALHTLAWYPTFPWLYIKIRIIRIILEMNLEEKYKG